MTADEFQTLKAGDIIVGQYSGREYVVLSAPTKTKKGLMVRARCAVYGDHEFYQEDLLNMRKKQA